MEVRIVLVTAPDAAVADKLARGLVEKKLAACVNVLPGVVSHYRWKGRLQKDRELLLIIKTKKTRLAELTRWVRAHHPASLPEVVALPVDGGSRPYLDWVAAST